jgi:hypothetical protein
MAYPFGKSESGQKPGTLKGGIVVTYILQL